MPVRLEPAWEVQRIRLRGSARVSAGGRRGLRLLRDLPQGECGTEGFRSHRIERVPRLKSTDTLSLSLSLSRSLARAPHAQRTTQSPSADKVAETEAATSSRAVHASFTVQETVSKTVSRSQRYLPHGGLGLCIVVCWAFLANDRKAEVKRRAEREKQAVLDEKKTWLK